MESLIRTHRKFYSLPVNTPFNWVDQVSVELTAKMLATLLDFPYEERRKLVYWSDLLAAAPFSTGGNGDINEMFAGAADMVKSFVNLWHDKAARLQAGEAPGFDLIP